MTTQIIINKDSEFFLPLQNASKIDILTPHKISVVFLIQEYLKLKTQDKNGYLLEESTSDTQASVEVSPEYRRKFCMLLLKLIQYPDMPYKDLYLLITSEKYRLHEQHLESFKTLMTLLNKLGIEVLFKLQNLIDKLISENSQSSTAVVSQFGIVGLYFRRVHVTLDKMSFPELMNLYKNINLYYEKGVRSLAIAPNIASNLSYEECFQNSQCKWSVKQSELFVAQQSALIENDEIHAMAPKDLQQRLNEIIQDNPLYSQAYFLSYMNQIRIRDLPNSIEALHRSFDRSTFKSMNTINEAVNVKTNYQFSILNLAILHTLYDHHQEALQCLKECIMTAQENGDRVCLQLAQLWLCLLDKSNFQLSEKNIANKTELSLVHSVSLNIQSLVKVAALSGYLPSKLFDVLLKSDILNCQHSMMDLLSNCIAERAGLWTLYGKNEIASLCSQLLLNSNLKTLDRTHNGEGLCQSLCSLALWMSLHGDYVTSSVILQHAKIRFPRYPISKNWMLCEYYITSQQAILLEKWTDANTACCSIYHLDRHLSILQRANLNIARGNRKFAQELLEEILKERSDEDNLDSLTKVRAMILMTQTLINRNKISTEALTILNNASIIAKEKHLEYEHSLIEMNLAYVLLNMQMPQQALKLLKANLENVLSNGGIYDKAKIQFLFVQCLIAASEGPQAKLEHLQQSFEMINSSVDYFKKLECHNKVKSVYRYLAKLYDQLNMPAERNNYALRFRLVAEEFTNNNNDNIHIFH